MHMYTIDIWKFEKKGLVSCTSKMSDFSDFEAIFFLCLKVVNIFENDIEFCAFWA